MNVVPMFLNVVIPWGVFVFCCGMTSFWVMYTRPALAYLAVGAVFVLWFFVAAAALWARRTVTDPTWFTYTALMVLAMAIAGTQMGLGNYKSYSKPYFDVNQLKVVSGIDASTVQAKTVMDGGLFNFKYGNHLDIQKSWHFRWQTTYCVAPIVTNDTAPLSQEYDFWAVGKECCSTGAADYHCGAWRTQGTAGGIRVVNEGDLYYYKLAVQQAESLYGISAPTPIFLSWSPAPWLEVESWNQQVFKNYLFMSVMALVICIFTMTLASCSFAFLGRRRSAYAAECFNDVEGVGRGGAGVVSYGNQYGA